MIALFSAGLLFTVWHNFLMMPLSFFPLHKKHGQQQNINKCLSSALVSATLFITVSLSKNMRTSFSVHMSMNASSFFWVKVLLSLFFMNFTVEKFPSQATCVMDSANSTSSPSTLPLWCTAINNSKISQKHRFVCNNVWHLNIGIRKGMSMM